MRSTRECVFGIGLHQVFVFNKLFSISVLRVCPGSSLLDVHRSCCTQMTQHPDPNFISDQYLGLAQPIIGRTVQEVKVDDEKLKAAQELCLLRDSSVFE